MKKMRKLNLLVLPVLVLFTFFSFDFSVTVLASDRKVDNGNATYRVEKTVEEFDLGYGIHYQRDIALTSVNTGHFAGQAAGSGGGGSIEPGKEYLQQVNWLDIDYDSDAQLIPYASLSAGLWNTMTVRKAAAEFEQKNPGKMVVAAINGDWFEISQETKASVGVTISNGEYLKSVSGYGGTHTLVFNNSGTGQRITEIKDYNVIPVLTIYDEEGKEVKKININKVNEEPGNGEIALYYAYLKPANNYSTKYEKVTVTDGWIVEKASAATTAVSGSFYGKGKVEKITGSYEIGQGKFAIKTNNSEIEGLLKAGMTIRCQYEYASADLKSVENAIGFPYEVMYDGKPVYTNDQNVVNNDAKYRKPRTIVGQREDGSIVLVNVDGRQPSTNMFGMTSMEMVALVEYYGCVDAWKLDGGGSATMIIRKQSGMNISASFNDSASSDWHVVNSPSDKSERSDGNCLLVVVDVPEVTLEVSEITNQYVVFHVALLTQIEKYAELYIVTNGEKYQVADNEVKIELKAGIEYECYVYGKNGDNFNDLGANLTVKSALPEPTEVTIKASIVENKGVKYIQLYYKVDKQAAVKKIEFIVEGDKVTTSRNLVANVLPSTDLFVALKGLDVNVLVLTSDFIGEKVLVFEDIEITYSVDFLFEEMLFTTNDILADIFDFE